MQRFLLTLGAATILAIVGVGCGGKTDDGAAAAAPADSGLSAQDQAQLEQAYEAEAASEITADNAEAVAAELEAEIAAEGE